MKPSGNKQGDQILKQTKDQKKQVKEKKKLLKKEQQRFQSEENSKEQNQNQNQQNIEDYVQSQQEVPNQTEQAAQNRDILFDNPVAENEAQEVAEKQEEVLEQANPHKKIKKDEGNHIEAQNREENQNIQRLIDMQQIVQEQIINENIQNQGIQIIQEQNGSNPSESNNGNNEVEQKQQEKEEQLQLYCDWKPYDHNEQKKIKQKQSYPSKRQIKQYKQVMRQKQQLRKLYRSLYDQQNQQGLNDFKHYYPNTQVDQNYRRLPTSHNNEKQKRIQQLIEKRRYRQFNKEYKKYARIRSYSEARAHQQLLQDLKELESQLESQQESESQN